MRTHEIQIASRRGVLASLLRVIAVATWDTQVAESAQGGADGRIFRMSILCANQVYKRERVVDAGLSKTTGAVSRIWQEAKSLGYDAYRKKLISEGKYRQQR